MGRLAISQDSALSPRVIGQPQPEKAVTTTAKGRGPIETTERAIIGCRISRARGLGPTLQTRAKGRSRRENRKTAPVRIFHISQSGP